LPIEKKKKKAFVFVVIIKIGLALNSDAFQTKIFEKLNKVYKNWDLLPIN
jgi:hypothetical protein